MFLKFNIILFIVILAIICLLNIFLELKTNNKNNLEKFYNKCRKFTCITKQSGNHCRECLPLKERKKDNHCKSCNDGYKLENGKCVECLATEKCIYPKTKCKKCSNNIGVKQYEQTKPCKIFNCKDGYQLKENKCVKIKNTQCKKIEKIDNCQNGEFLTPNMLTIKSNTIKNQNIISSLQGKYLQLNNIKNNNRPVWKKLNEELYLYHFTNLWIVGPRINQPTGYLFVSNNDSIPPLKSVWFIINKCQTNKKHKCISTTGKEDKFINVLTNPEKISFPFNSITSARWDEIQITIDLKKSKCIQCNNQNCNSLQDQQNENIRCVTPSIKNTNLEKKNNLYKLNEEVNVYCNNNKKVINKIKCNYNNGSYKWVDVNNTDINLQNFCNEPICPTKKILFGDRCVTKPNCINGNAFSITQSNVNTINGQDDLCISCNLGYKLQNQKCKPFGCNTKNFGNSCLKCKPQEFRRGENDCLQCNPGYYKKFNESKNVDECIAFGGFCKNGTLIEQKYRKKENHCEGCNIGYQLNVNSKSCEESICVKGSGSNCKTCIDAKDRISPEDCKECNDGYFLKNKRCFPKKPKCMNGVVPSIPSDLQLVNVNSDINQCKSCNAGYKFL
mgnify:CR=1 FL=1